MTKISKMRCADCGATATKSRRHRWQIKHTRGCVTGRHVEDIGPVTALNDPDNVAWVIAD